MCEKGWYSDGARIFRRPAGRRVYEHHGPHTWHEGAYKALPSVPAAPPDDARLTGNRNWPRAGRHLREFAKHASEARERSPASYPIRGGGTPGASARDSADITGIAQRVATSVLPAGTSIATGRRHCISAKSSSATAAAFCSFSLAFPPSTIRQREHGLFPSKVLFAASTIPTRSALSTSIPVQATV